MKIYFENGVTPPNVQILPDTDPTPSGYTEDTSIDNFFEHGTAYGLETGAVAMEIIKLIPDWATWSTANKLKLKELCKWQPTAITLGDWLANGAGGSLSSGAGLYFNFSGAGDDELVCCVGLSRNGVPYDGSDIAIELNNQKFGATGGTVKIELDYYFAKDGSDSYTGTDGTIVTELDVTSRGDQIQFTDILAGISGEAGSTQLQLTLRVNATGSGQGTYSGDFEVYGTNLIKV